MIYYIHEVLLPHEYFYFKRRIFFMSMVFRKNLVNAMTVENQEQEEKELRYLLLVYTEETKGEPIQIFDIVDGRAAALDRIYVFYEEYGTIDWFKSTIISEKVTPQNGISFYSFMRYVFETKPEDFVLPNVGNYEDLIDLISEDPAYNEYCEKHHLYTDDDLDIFYDKDMAHNI